jgi:hypothetical protein
MTRCRTLGLWRWWRWACALPWPALNPTTLRLTHDGGYGGLAGKTVALEPAAGFSFDSPLEARPR